MKKALLRLLCLAMVLSLAALPVISASADNYGYFYVKTSNGGKLNVRTDPVKVTGNVIAQINYRSYVLVYQYNENGTWAYIEASNPTGSGTVKGWVQTSFLVANDPGPYSGGGTTPVTPTTGETFDTINAAAKAMRVLATPYQTVIQTKTATNYVHLRWFPSTNAAYSGAYLCDTAIEVLAESNTWAQVRILADGKVGFILKTCVTPVLY